ncbi:hypothetical protein [Natronoglycomyces albus]|uniref:Uncharacterized protein n=1 Tax=Natronoglycomyces albus TaxID=2811108 RepID=A0A895XUR6_9ACTN|nr:hypothetical protein [Natronoglycomyces albus]QSB07203.1 hypothetical protein JQS30_17005 [Natronoglycomyces albus]
MSNACAVVQDWTFLRQYRREQVRFGVSLQLSTLPWLGFVPQDVATAPGAVVFAQVSW